MVENGKRNQTNGWKWESNPWTCVWQPNNALFFISWLFFIPWSWWWWLSNFEKWQKVPMKLDIVYMDTISLAESHCTGVWEVYHWTIYQRLAFKTCLAAKCILRGPGKREIWNPVYICTRGGGGGKEGLCIFSPLMVISLAECTLKREI